MINNLEQIKQLLEFKSEDEFYFLQLIQRKKEIAGLGSNNHVVHTYYITSKENLELKFPEIQLLCNFHNARAYINLNKRSFKKLAFKNLQKVADQILNEDYKSVRRAYNSVAGKFSHDENKSWIIDIDHKRMREINDFIVAVDKRNPVGSKYIALIETKNGYHYICKPFNRMFSSDFIYDYEIHTNNPTILYVP